MFLVVFIPPFCWSSNGRNWPNRKIHSSTGTGSKVVVCQMPLMHVESATFNTWHTLAASDKMVLSFNSWKSQSVSFKEMLLAISLPHIYIYIYIYYMKSSAPWIWRTMIHTKRTLGKHGDFTVGPKQNGLRKPKSGIDTWFMIPSGKLSHNDWKITIL